MRAVLLLTALLLGGCFNPTYSDGGFRCDKTRRCPEGLSCVFNGTAHICTRQLDGGVGGGDGGDGGPTGVLAVGGWRMVFEGTKTASDCGSLEVISLDESVFYVEKSDDSGADILRGGRVSCVYNNSPPRMSCPSVSTSVSRPKGGELKYRSTILLRPTSRTLAAVDFTEVFTSCTGPDCPTGYPCTVQYTGQAAQLPRKLVPAESCSVVGTDPPGKDHALVVIVNRGSERRLIYRFDSQQESLVQALGTGDNVLLVDRDRGYIVVRDESKKCLSAFRLDKAVFNIIELK